MSFPRVRLGDVATVNPPRAESIDDALLVTFVPMEAVDATLGEIRNPILRPFGQVKKGYTAFVEGDVLFAKVSPCMQNGKHAVVRELVNGRGFGSTEFHVVRCGPHVLPGWLHHFLRMSSTLSSAMQSFNGAVGLQRVPPVFLENLHLPLPTTEKQRVLSDVLTSQLAVVEQARQASLLQLEELVELAHALIRESCAADGAVTRLLGDVLEEVKLGVGANWAEFPVLGATRGGLAPAKEAVGKAPERYKPVQRGSVFYNPMRILIGSVAMVDDGDEPGITSPDYVVLRGRPGHVDSRWFYYWLRSPEGERCIASLARGAVRERMLFNRLAEGNIHLPPLAAQERASRALAEIRPMQARIQAQLRDIEQLPARLLAQVFDTQGETDHE